MRIWGALAIVYVVWGSTFAAIELAVRTIPPSLAMSMRHLFAGAVLVAWAYARGPRERIGRPQIVAAFIFGGALFLGGHGLLAWAQQEIPSGVAALLIASIPLWVAVLDRLVFGKRLSGRAIVGLALGFGGVALLVDPTGGGTIDTLGAIAAVLAAGSWAAGSLYSRDAPLPKGPLLSAGLASLAGGFLLGLAALFSGELASFHPSQVSGESWFGEIYLIVMGSFVGLTAYVWLLKNAPISLVATYAYVNPVVAMLIGWTFLSETFSPMIILAGGAIIVAVVLIVSAPTPTKEYGWGLRRRGSVTEEAVTVSSHGR
jgi:drug/metabolite transporter (DMT)-like permease